MERVLLTQKPKRDRKRERDIMNKLTLNDSGFVIYPGKGPEYERTGSPFQLLIDWFLYKKGKEKPLDFDIFVQHLNETMPPVPV